MTETKNRKKTISLSIKKELAESALKQAAAQNRSLSNYVETLIKLDKENPDPTSA